MLKGFPSPLGASYFQITSMTNFFQNMVHCFRPLSGHLISKLSYNTLVAFIDDKFPSPLGASYFQIK